MRCQVAICLCKIGIAMCNRQWFRSRVSRWRNKSSTAATNRQRNKWMMMQIENKVSFLNLKRAEHRRWQVVNLKLMRCQKILRIRFKSSQRQRIMRVKVICLIGQGGAANAAPPATASKASPNSSKKSIWMLRIRIMRTRRVRDLRARRMHQSPRKTIWNKHYKSKRSSRLWS